MGSTTELAFESAVPDFPFRERWFTVKVVLRTEGDVEKLKAEVPLTLHAEYENHASLPRDRAAPGLLVCEHPDKFILDKNTGFAKTRVKFTACSADVGGKLIRLVARLTKGGNYIGDAVSRPMKVVRYRLVFDEATSAWEETWYKNEGGQANCLTVGAKLIDDKDKVVADMAKGAVAAAAAAAAAFELKAVVFYGDSLERVQNQSILNVVDEAELRLVRGSCRVRVRLDEVSSKHQSQSFRVALTAPAAGDVGDAFSPRVIVKSKRNNVNGRRNINNNNIVSQSPSLAGAKKRALAALPKGDDYDSSSSRAKMNNDNSKNGGAASSSAASSSAASSSPPKKKPRRAHRVVVQNHGLVVPAAEAAKFKRAHREAADWVKVALESMRTVAWKVRGYEVTPDGNRRPHYEMVNPNDLIQSLTASYETQVARSLEDLGTLVAALDSSQIIPPPAVAATASASTAGSSSMSEEDEDDDEDPAADEEEDHAGTLAAKGLRPMPLDRRRSSVEDVYDIIAHLRATPNADGAAAMVIRPAEALSRFPSLPLDSLTLSALELDAALLRSTSSVGGHGSPHPLL